MDVWHLADDAEPPFKRRRVDEQTPALSLQEHDRKLHLLEEKLDRMRERAEAAEVERDASNARAEAAQEEAACALEAKSWECVQDMRGFQVELEAWRHQVPGPAKVHMRPHLIPQVQEMLRKLVPYNHHSDCAKMRNAVVATVQCVTNMQLWKRYNFTRQEFSDSLRQRHDCPWATTIAPQVQQLEELLEYPHLERCANEVLLLHGTADDNVAHILQEGFDDRLSQRKLYGPGIYFTTDACKAAQYCGHGATGCIIIARVLLGHPFLAEGPLPKTERPPLVERHGVPHNSVIARPGIPNGKGKAKGKGKQVHWEFVVPRGDLQIYPELIIRFAEAPQ